MDKYIDKLYDYLPNILFALITFAAGYLIIKVVIRLLREMFARSKLDETGWKFILSAIKVGLYVMLFVMILAELKVPMASIITALGTAGVAIVVGLKDSLTNVAGGFIVLFGSPFKSGDFVEIAGQQGYVDRVSMLYTRLLTMDNKAVMIPNSTVATTTVINYTQEDMRRLELWFNISYSTDIGTAKQVLLDTVSSNPLSLDKPDEPYIRVSEQSDSSIVLLLRVWVKTSDYWELRYGLLSEVKEAFDREGVSIPFPQLDVHLDKH